jgi:hypothetical protein
VQISNQDFWMRVEEHKGVLVGEWRQSASDLVDKLANPAPSLNMPLALTMLYEQAIGFYMVGSFGDFERCADIIVDRVSNIPARDVHVRLRTHTFNALQVGYNCKWALTGHRDGDMLELSCRLVAGLPWLIPGRDSTVLKSQLLWTFVELDDPIGLRSLMESLQLLKEPSTKLSTKPSEAWVLNLVLGVMEGREDLRCLTERAMVRFMQQNILWKPPVVYFDYSPETHGIKWLHARARLFTGETDFYRIIADLKTPEISLRS